MPVWVGLDCGGSSTRVWAADETGIIFKGQSRSANLANTPPERILRHLQNATFDCPAADAVCGCFAGLVGPTQQSLALELLAEVFGDCSIRAEPDFAAGYANFDEPLDLMVVCGTGSIVCSKVGDQWIRSGGGGYLLGDEASGFQFGRDAIRHYLRNPKQASEPMLQALRQTIGVVEPAEVIAKIYGSPIPAANVAKFAKVIGKDASAGKEYAIESLHHQFSQLAGIIRGHIQKLGFQGPELCLGLTGGLWKSGIQFSQIFTKELEGCLEYKLKVLRSQQSPIEGALKLAQEILIVDRK